MARSAYFGYRFYSGRRSAVVAVTTVARRGGHVVLLQKGNAMDTFGKFFELVGRNFIRLHQPGVAVAVCARRRNVCRIHFRLHIFCRTNIVAAMAACTLRRVGVAFRITDAMNTCPVLVELIDRHRRIVGSHKRGVGMTLCACFYYM